MGKRILVVLVEYDQDIANTNELELTWERTTQQYEGVTGVYAEVVTPEKATQIRMGLGTNKGSDAPEKPWADIPPKL